MLKPLESLELLNTYISDIGKSASNIQAHSEIKNKDGETERVESGLTQRSYHSVFAGME